MRRIVAFVVLIAITFMCIYSVAEEAKEITFQGVPWFSSPDEVTKLLGESGFTSGRAFDIQKLKNKDSLSNSNIASYKKDKKVPYTYSNSTKDKKLSTKLLDQWQNHVEKTLAKHKVHFLTAYYTAEPNNPQLVEFEMTLRDPDGGDYDKKVIYDALVSAYGKPKASRSGKEYIWLGENNTIAILNKNHVVFATLSGLEYAEAIELNLEVAEDTGF